MIAIVTDSSAYLSLGEAEQMGVTVVPMSYSVDEQNSVLEKCVDENGDYETLVKNNIERMRTSQATYQAFITVFEELKAKGSDVICLTMSSRLSGTYGNARMAAREVSPERIQVIDSKSTGSGLFLMIREADRMIRDGVDFPMIAHKLRVLRDRIGIAFSVDDIMPLRKSGRLSGVKLSISTILNLKPMLRCVNGSIVATGTARGRQEQMRTLKNSLPDAVSACVIEGFAADHQIEMLRQLLEKAGKSILIRKIGPVLAVHLGIGCVGIAWIDQSAT